ncbi:hypothetical protein [Cupriavidus necator]|uniref:hypothetical protein n=1 Tax=Cupriavidus necator TaxID=106590 RepID=UPI002784DBC8|nr:hypothetical protein [Cupriavidus necator]MDQ0140965.1 hypothetical protein [Cupriavidus necator]
MVPTVRIEQGGTAFELAQGATDVEVFEGALLGSIEASSRPLVELNDQRMPVSWNPGAKLGIWSADLTNQVGFHRLRVQVAEKVYTFDFRTCTAKAAWAEVQLMAEICAGSYLGYRRQFTYMAANGMTRKVRLPQIHYAWIRERLPEIERLVRSIEARPATSSFRTHQISLCSKGLSVPHTSRLLREKHHLLELDEQGPIHSRGQRYWPSRVVVSTNGRHSQLEEHAQIAAFLQLLATESQDLAGVVAAQVRDKVQQFFELIKTLRGLSVFGGIIVRPHARPTSVLPTNIQRTDRRYGRLRELQAEYLAEISESVDYARSIRANVRDVWDIYQTFVAHVIGNALGLKYFADDGDLRKRSPHGWSMASGDWRMYFDTKPQKGELPSWRDATGRPADERPDIILIGRRPGEVVLLDAKFKIDSVSSRATQADLFEMQGYLNSFATKRGGILYPGPSPTASVIAAKGNALLELPIRASHFGGQDGTDAVHQYVREALQSVHAAAGN